jgi:hypothetical protein
VCEARSHSRLGAETEEHNSHNTEGYNTYNEFFHIVSPILLTVYSLIPELLIVSITLLWEIQKTMIGGIIIITVAAIELPERAIPPAEMEDII